VSCRSLYGQNARELLERTNEVTGQYAKACVEIAKEMGVAHINLWSKMQETDGWQKKFLWCVTTSTQEIYTMTNV
jgi:hypothetical protein